MIVKPEQMDFTNKNLNIIISGLPGVGKTTLALSAPDPLLVDFDEGVVRIKPDHRKDSIIAKTYEEFLSDIEQAKGTYKTIIIDTGGAQIETMKDWAMRNEPTANKKSGGFSLQGYGIIKTEYLRISAQLRKNFHVVTLFHTSKEMQDDNVFFDISCEGAARHLVWQPADLGAYMHMVNGERYLGFTPTANYNAKSAYGIKGLVKVPELKAGEPNDFLTRLFAQIKTTLAVESQAQREQQKAYNEVIQTGNELINSIDSPERAIPVLNEIRNLAHALTSQKELEAAFKEKIKELGYTYDAKVKAYVQKEG